MSPITAFGRGQLLFLLVTWVGVVGAFTQALPGMSGRGVFLVPAGFWIILWTTLIILYLAARLTLATHDQPLPGSALRFAGAFSSN